MKILCLLFWHRPIGGWAKAPFMTVITDNLSYKISICERCAVLFCREIEPKK